MPFTATTFNSGAAPGIDAGVLNTMQTQYVEAVSSFEQDLLTPYVFTGMVSTKDGTTATQLDVTNGTAFIRQTDSSVRRRSVAPATYSTVGHASATLFLDIQADGTFSFATTHSADANHLTICTVTTDASANIATVTDTRPLNTTMFSGMAGVITMPPLATSAATVGGQPTMVQGAGSYAGFHVFVQPGTPTGMVKGDCWIKTPF